MLRSPLNISAAAMLAATSFAHAQHAGDIILAADAQQITTSAAVSGSLVPTRVFLARFGDSGFSNRTTNPGLNALAGDLPPGTVIGLTIRKAARVWFNNSFCTIPDERIQVRKSPVTIESPAADPAPGTALPSLDVGITGSDGGLHEHPAWSITTPFDTGVYLLEVSVYAGSPQGGLPLPSSPTWIVFSQNAAQTDIDSALVWTLANLPGSLNPCCRADFNQQGGVTVQDIFDFLSAWFANQPAADFNQQGGITVQDIFDFLSAWFAGC